MLWNIFASYLWRIELIDYREKLTKRCNGLLIKKPYTSTHMHVAVDGVLRVISTAFNSMDKPSSAVVAARVLAASILWTGRAVGTFLTPTPIVKAVFIAMGYHYAFSCGVRLTAGNTTLE
jgi:hypothetical protein